MKIRICSLAVLWSLVVCLIAGSAVANDQTELEVQSTTTEEGMLDFFVQFDGICRAGLMRYEKRLPEGVMRTEDDVRHAYYACEIPSHALFKGYFAYKERFFREHHSQNSDTPETEEFSPDQLLKEVKLSHDQFIREIRETRIKELKVENAPHWVGKKVAEYTQRIIEQDQKVYNDFAERFTSLKPTGTEMQRRGARLAKNRILHEDLIWLDHHAGSELEKLTQCSSNTLHGCPMMPPVDLVSGAISKFKFATSGLLLKKSFDGVLENLKGIEEGHLCQVGDYAMQAARELEALKERQPENTRDLMMPGIELDELHWDGQPGEIPFTRLLLNLPLAELMALQPKVNHYRKSWD